MLKAIAALLAGLLPLTAAAQPAPSFQGKTITIYVGFGAGGGYDIYGRLVAQHLGRHLPGVPSIVVSNMTGAGSLVAANHLYAVAPKDGTALGVIDQNIAISQVMGDLKNIDATKYNWIGRMASGVETITVWHSVPVRSIEDAKKTVVAIAGSGPTASSVMYPIVLNNVIGTRFKTISGYTGTAEMLMAMERREVDACGALNVATMSAAYAQHYKSGKIVPIVQFSQVRHPYIKDTPTALEIATTDEQKSILRVFAAGGDFGRYLLAPPGLTPEVVAVLRTAFMKAMNDPELKSQAQRANIDVEPMHGDDLQKMVSAVALTPKAIIDAAIAAKHPK